MSDEEKIDFSEYEDNFSDSAFWDKFKRIFKKASRELLEVALKLYYALMDSDTPVWAKSIVVGALGYLILPFDLIPDVIPVVGLTDDLSVLVAAAAAIATHIKEEHREKAIETLNSWFGKSSNPSE